jgi:[acyl-carrier-protein] S-malonyltransferase
MQSATDELRGELMLVELETPAAPVVSNQDAAAYADGDGWRDRLPEHVSVPVQWRRSMDTLVSLGADSFVEVGHGSMLAALAKRGAPDVTVRNVATPEDLTPTPKVEVG